ncbi:MAG TPA: cytosine permease [Nocardioidaceae bacterium]|nr:cytosine permease [Nocardioidaceae bacterium]
MSSSTSTSTGAGRPPTRSGAGSVVESNGINVIDESERKGRPNQLFWPWAASNISILGMAWGAYVLGFGVNLWQGIAAGMLGVIGSFTLVGLVAIAGKRGSAPTLTLSRAPFGIRGNILPGLVSYLLLVGWEIALVSIGTFASATVFTRLGWGGGDLTKVVAFLLIVAIIVVAGILGFDAIMRLQKWLTIATIVATVVFMVLTAKYVDLSAATSGGSGGLTSFLGATLLVFTGFGIGWTNCGADYSRYLPRRSSSPGIVGWTTAGASLPVVVLVVWGLLLCASDEQLAGALGSDPVGGLTALVPTWFLVPFFLVAVAGLISGAILDLYSSGLTLLAVGLRVPRWAAAGLDGVLMILGSIYVIWFAADFLGPFQGFLITLGVPLAAWCGIFLADLLLRRRDYDPVKLFDAGAPQGYGSFNVVPVLLLVAATVVGLGLVTNTYAQWLSWQGYLLGPVGLGGKEGDWAFANIGVVVALAIGFLGYLGTQAGAVRRSEAPAR